MLLLSINHKHKIMEEQPIELELRAEIPFHELEKIKKHIEGFGKLASKTKRLSVMYFGKIEDNPVDIRVRITDGKSEVVIKSGAYVSNNRLEISQPIETRQFLGMVKLFSLFGFSTMISERETYNYLLPDNVIVSLVLADRIAYVEFELISSKENFNQNKEKLTSLVNQFDLQIMTTDEEFEQHCKRLDAVDWTFKNQKEDYDKLRLLLDSHMKEI